MRLCSQNRLTSLLWPPWSKSLFRARRAFFLCVRTVLMCHLTSNLGRLAFNIFFWKSMPTNYSRLGESDWSLLKPLLQTTKLCTRPAKRDDTRCPGRKTRSTTMGPVRLTQALFLDVGNEQAPSRCNNQLAEAPILHVAVSKNKSRSWERPRLTRETAL